MLSDEFVTFLHWCGNHPYFGAFLYSLIFSVGAVLCLPEIALAAVSGYLFPYHLAFLATWAGGVLGASLSFLCGRYVLRGCTKCLFKGKSDFLEELALFQCCPKNLQVRFTSCSASTLINSFTSLCILHVHVLLSWKLIFAVLVKFREIC